jgi:acyl transferase domain-containing protein/thioesterase domain-containing protein/acyl carrier protein
MDQNSYRQSFSEQEIQDWLVNQLAGELGIDPEEIDVREPFESYGLSSREAVTMAGDLEDWLDRRLPATLAWQYPTIETLASFLASGKELPDEISTVPTHEEADLNLVRDSSAPHEPIAIIGMGCRFPGANGLTAFWRLLQNGVDAISEVPPDRWSTHEFYDPDPSIPGKTNTRWGGFLRDVDQFDSQFFGISPREATRMDPQQRILLEVAWEALEDAGLASEQLSGSRTGVYIGISGNEYGQIQLGNPSLIDGYAGTGNALSIAANRISYFFNFQGPSIALDTACSSSLVAVHLACNSLWQGESELALSGGVNLILSPAVTINFTKAGAMASDGRCKTFDARADGYVRSEGAGVVVLKPLSQALADGDPIYALIRGSAISQDGRSNGLMAPNPQAQEKVLRMALRQAGVTPDQIQYVETHGTGTFLGDPIEIQALAAVLAPGRSPDNACAIGSVKTNLGHMEAAAGVAGLIKVALALKHATLPASLHFETPNPNIPFDKIPLHVQSNTTPWPKASEPALAGVSSFGFGGTNAHIVLEEAPQTPLPYQDQATADERVYLLPVSAHSSSALQSQVKAYREFLKVKTGEDRHRLHDICYTASLRRAHHDHRLAITGKTSDDFVNALDAYLRQENFSGMSSGRISAGRQHKPVFVFPGQGSQWFGMGRQLLDRESVFREALKACEQALKQYVDWSLLAELTANEPESRLDQIDILQPALFAIQVGLAALWRSWGLEPKAVVGHSMGEIAAAYVAGALSLEDATRIICHRSRLLKKTSGQGAMVAVQLSLKDAREAIASYEDHLCVAVSNSPGSTVISGDPSALEELVANLRIQDVLCQFVKVDVAAHSPQVESLKPELVREIQGIRPQPGTIKMYSSVIGEAIQGQALDADYWGQNLREPVLFAATVQRLAQDGHDIFLEMSPHPILVGAIQQGLLHIKQAGNAFASLRRNEDERAALLTSLGGLYTIGYPLDWRRLYPFKGQFLRLPSYPWQRQRYWMESGREEAKPLKLQPGKKAPERISESTAISDDPRDWLCVVNWQPRDRQPGEHGRPASQAIWLIYADERGIGEALAYHLEAQGERCIKLSTGDTFARLSDTHFCIHPNSREDLGRVFETALSPDQPTCRGVIHLWSLDSQPSESLTSADLETQHILECGSVLNLVQAMEEAAWRRPPRLWLVTQGAQSVIQGSETVAVAQSSLWGFGRTIALEYPAIWGGLLDLDPGSIAGDAANLLWEEIWYTDGADQVAFRQGQRYIPSLERYGEAGAFEKPFRCRPDASYLITGGLGALGMLIARWLITHGARYLTLVDVFELPPRKTWDKETVHRMDGRTAEIIDAIHEFEKQGATIRLANLDVTDPNQLADFVEEHRRNAHPPIRGVVHAAGILRDKTLSNLDLETLQEVFRPKMVGSWLLHSLFNGQHEQPDLDFFLLFSSAASILGSPGHANYTAANAFLDALAHYRRASGLAALSVNWGPWEEVGLEAQPDWVDRLAQYGVGSIPLQQGLAILERLIQVGDPQVGVIPADWEKVSHYLISSAGSSFFDNLLLVHALGSSSWSLPPQPAALPARESLDHVAPSKPSPEPIGSLEIYLQRQISQVLYLAPEEISPNRHFMELGLDSLMAMELIRNLERDFQIRLYPREIFEQPSVRALAAYISAELELQNGRGVEESLQSVPPVLSTSFSSLVFGSRGEVESATQPLAPALILGKRNPAMVFLLSGPRSGSTLLRVMLAGHPALFCPPELHLLQFERMQARRQGLGATYLNEGLQRAFMELEGLDSTQSKILLGELDERDAPVQEVYARLQEHAGSRLLVDKSPSYGSNMDTLERAEAMFNQPKYIFLTRHPYAAIESFVRNRFDKLLGAGQTDPLMLAEMAWATINANVIDFLHQVPEKRWHKVKFEDLVDSPETESMRLCEFLGIPYDQVLLHPYQGNRMTDGVHAMSMGINDPNFMNHDQIDSTLGGVWKEIVLPRRLDGFARRIALELDYDLPHEDQGGQRKFHAGAQIPALEEQSVNKTQLAADTPNTPLVEIQPMGSKRPLFFVHPGSGVVYPYYELARALGKERPFFALQDLSLEGDREPYTNIEAYAEEYLEAIRTIQPQGPYYLGGWSFGGHVAIEMARRLVAKGQPIGLLFILDTEAPVAGRKLTLLQRVNHFKNRMIEYISGAPDLIPYIHDALYLLNEKHSEVYQQSNEKLSLREYFQWAWTDAMRKRLNERSEIAQVIARDKSLKQVRLPNSNVRRGLYILRRHLAIVRRFKPQVYPGKLVFLRAEDQILRQFYNDRELGWGDLADTVEVHTVPGNHVTIFREPNVHAVARKLQKCINRFEQECEHTYVPAS